MKKSTLFVIVILIVSVGLLGAYSAICFSQLNDRGDKTTTPTEQPAGSVTMANYLKIKTDMTKAEVFKLLGKGEETSRVGEGKIILSSYSWTIGIFGASCNVMFQNDKVTGKGQMGLK